MENSEARKLSNGIYKIKWKGGGSSVAAIGRDRKGDVWLQPANWISTTAPTDYWDNVKSVELIKASKN
jgi:hypothetical protein